MITSPEERALYAEWSKLWDKHTGRAREEVMALSRQGCRPDSAREAHELNTKTVNKMALEADTILQEGHRPQQCRRRQGGREDASQLAAAPLL